MDNHDTPPAVNIEGQLYAPMQISLTGASSLHQIAGCRIVEYRVKWLILSTITPVIIWTEYIEINLN